MKKRFLIVLAAAVLAAAGLFYLYLTKEGAGSGISCPIHALTGLYCPGCGASRAIRSLLHLDFLQALRYNAFITVASPFIGLYVAALAVSYVRLGEDRVSRKIPITPIVIFASLAILYGVLRNIPAFSFLAPMTLS